MLPLLSCEKKCSAVEKEREQIEKCYRCDICTYKGIYNTFKKNYKIYRKKKNGAQICREWRIDYEHNTEFFKKSIKIKLL